MDAETADLRTTVTNQDPGERRDELRDSDLYSPPEDDTAHLPTDNEDEPEYDETAIQAVIDMITETIVDDLQVVTCSYARSNQVDGLEVHEFDITGFADSEGITGTGVTFDQLEAGQAFVDDAGRIVEHEYRVTDTEADVRETPRLTHAHPEAVVIDRPSWVTEEFDDSGEEDDETSRAITMSPAGDAIEVLSFESPEDATACLLGEVDGQPPLVLDPDGAKGYNENARTQWNAVLEIMNNGSREIDGVFLEISADETADDAAHDHAISFITGDVYVSATGENNLLDFHELAVLGPGESIPVGLVLDLAASDIEDIESGADMDLIGSISR